MITCGVLFIGSSKKDTKENNFYSKVVLVHPYRYANNQLEYLLIKRKFEGYNWQGVTGSLEGSETPREGAIREIFEETGYNTAFISNILPLPDGFYIGKEGQGEIWEGHYNGDSYIRLDEKTMFIARIDETQDPIINPEEHTDWKWCNYDQAYALIRWDLEKRLLRYINKMLVDKKIKEE